MSARAVSADGSRWVYMLSDPFCDAGSRVTCIIMEGITSLVQVYWYTTLQLSVTGVCEVVILFIMIISLSFLLRNVLISV